MVIIFENTIWVRGLGALSVSLIKVATLIKNPKWGQIGPTSNLNFQSRVGGASGAEMRGWGEGGKREGGGASGVEMKRKEKKGRGWRKRRADEEGKERKRREVAQAARR